MAATLWASAPQTALSTVRPPSFSHPSHKLTTPVINVDFSWSLASDDTRILAAARNIVARANATAYAQGLGFPYLYENYAALEQPVFPSYGAANYAKLQAVSKKYDPSGVWQTLQPGYFKVF